MAQRIRRIDPFSAAKIAGVLYGIIGVLFLPFILMVNQIAPAGQGFPIGGVGLAMIFVGAYAVIGFVFTLIAAALYNLVAGWVGGLELELE